MPEMNGGGHDDREDALAIVRELAAGLSVEEQHALLDRLAFGPSGGFDPVAPRQPPSRRRPRRADVLTYRVRVDVDGTSPPLWRRLELASDLLLDEVHAVLQLAFGWTDSHLHEFAAGPHRRGPDTERYLCPYMVDEEPDQGVPAHEVRLDEVLVNPGDRIFYTYDFGDDWAHTVRLEAVAPREADASRARCTGGRRGGPPEDCGGVHGYELVAAASDPAHPDHDEAITEHAEFYGDEVDPTDRPPVPFEVDKVNSLLDDLGFGVPSARAEPSGSAEAPPGALGDLLESVKTAPVRRRLRALVAAARLDEAAIVDADVAAQMARPFAALLTRVGEEGVQLTRAGYLPPALVKALFDELDLADEWIGAANREELTAPVLHLRETAQRMGLLRKHRGRLLLTATGRTLRDDPAGLWWHLAERTPPRTRDEAQRLAGVVTLLAVAAEADEEHHDLVADVLADLGWRQADRTPPSSHTAARLAWDTTAVLRRLGGLADHRGSRHASPTPRGVAFARAALQTWPAGAG